MIPDISERWSGLFEQQKGFLSDKLLLFKKLAATLLPVIRNHLISGKLADFRWQTVSSDESYTIADYKRLTRSV